MTLEIIDKETIPIELRIQLLDDENIYYFSYISYNGGCLSSSTRDEYWIALTNKKAVYKTNIIENERITEKNGILPLEKISFIEVTDIKEKNGCSSIQNYYLRISTSGGTVDIPIPTKGKGFEIRTAYLEIVEELKGIK